MSWRLVYYESSDGKRPLVDYISSASLTPAEEANVEARVEILEEHGPLAALRLPDVYRQLKGEFKGVFQIRLKGTHNARVFYFIDENRNVVLLSGVSKKGMRATGREMKNHYRRALRYRDDWIGRCT